MKRIFQVFLLTFVTSLIGACGLSRIPPKGIPAPDSYTTNGCISPIVVSAYPVGDIVPTPPAVQDVLPKNWDAVSSIPNTLSGQDTIGYLMLVRQRYGYDELWVVKEDQTLLVYRTDTKEWVRLPHTPKSINRLFLDANDVVWAVSRPTGKKTPILYRFDDKLNVFITIIDEENVLSDGYIINVNVGKDGLFWFIFFESDVRNSSIYSFDSSTLKTKRYLPGNDYYSLEIDGNGNLFILQGQNTLTRFEPTTGNVKSIEIPYRFEAYGSENLYLDRQNRLWVSDKAWFDTSNPDMYPWYFVIPSPIFIDYIKGHGRYSWTIPEIQLESDDGILWYRSSRGQAWFNPDTGEWCLFTTYSGNIVEDSEHNLWMLIEDTLYKYKVE